MDALICCSIPLLLFGVYLWFGFWLQARGKAKAEEFQKEYPYACVECDAGRKYRYSGECNGCGGTGDIRYKKTHQDIKRSFMYVIECHSTKAANPYNHQPRAWVVYSNKPHHPSNPHHQDITMRWFAKPNPDFDPLFASQFNARSLDQMTPISSCDLVR